MIKRLLLLTFVFSGLVFGQTLSGSWAAKVSLLPPPVGLASTEFTLRGKLFGWTVGGRAEFFGSDGWVWQTFTAQGDLGPVSSEWTALFGPLAPAFLYLYGKYSLTISGMDAILHTAMVGPDVPPYVFTGGPSGGTVLETRAKLNGLAFSTEIGFGARKQDFTLVYSGFGSYEKVFPVDPFPGGLEFTYLKLSAEGLPLCCGIALDLGFSFTKEGFDELSVTAKTIPLCCGISFDASVNFTTTSKEVEIKPKWAGIEGCFTVYGDVHFQAPSLIQGLEIYGLKLRCDLGDCTYAEFLTALDVIKVEEILKEDIFQGGEFEYVKLGFCGAGCCGGKWTLGIGFYFQRTGSLFGLSRILADLSFPLMANFTAHVDLSAPVGGLASLTLGWTFSF
ncbi:MAG: hypothetical protein ACPLRP_00965 [Candidatus Bipolaricaulaceae bacterium]